GQTGLVKVAFSPVTAGTFNNQVIFISNGGNSTNLLTGTAITPGQLTVLPGALDFGTVAVGTFGQASFVLTNSGGAPITNGLASVNDTGFTIISGTPFNLSGFGSTNVVVRFAPTAEGNFSNV